MQGDTRQVGGEVVGAHVLRVYDPAVDVFAADGYPVAWGNGKPPIKDLIREEAGNRCVRCGHPYLQGMGEWSPCDAQCSHDGPVRLVVPGGEPVRTFDVLSDGFTAADVVLMHVPLEVEACWRVLTVHHLNGVKGDCRWWNLCALCQRCHLTIQGRVQMERVYVFEHSDWFKPYAAGWYASAYLGEELTREETLARLDELLSLERAA